jgi:preprotein translocase subunit SecE
VARDRKRAKQRRARGGGAAVRRRAGGDGTPNGAPSSEGRTPAGGTGGQATSPGQSTDQTSAGTTLPGALERTDLPGSLDHASADVDEFDAALIRGAGGVPVAPGIDESAFGVETASSPDGEDALQEPQSPVGPGGSGGAGGGGAGGGSGGGGEVERPSGAPLRGGNRAIGFLRASWAELQRVQWPDRRQVTQATAVVIGFVAIAGVYLGVADTVAKEIVEFVL